MTKAFAVKGLAVGIAVLAIAMLPSGWGAAAAAVVIAATVAFLTYAVWHPSSQFFVPVMDRLATDEPIVALTFDDGPDPIVTPQILDVLAAHHVRATFFVVGERARCHPELIQRIHREGHSIGTHTQHHRVRFHFGSNAYVRREIQEAVETVATILSVRPTLFRPPQGLRTPLFASGWQGLEGLVCVTWSVRGRDSLPTTARAIVARIEKGLLPGAIVTMHDGTGLGGGTDRTPTLEALRAILSTCEARGLRCVPLTGAVEV